MRGAYGRPPVDRRVRERLRTGSDGTAGPVKVRQDRREPQDRWFSPMNSPCIEFAFFRPELAHCQGENASRVHKKVPGDTRGLARQNWHTAPDIFLPPSTWGPFCQVFRLWTLQTIGTLVGTFVTNRQKSVKIEEIGENH